MRRVHPSLLAAALAVFLLVLAAPMVKLAAMERLRSGPSEGTSAGA